MPTLTHIFSGPAHLLQPSAHNDSMVPTRVESISGCFRLVRIDDRGMVLGNGESPETQWLVSIPKEVAA